MKDIHVFIRAIVWDNYSTVDLMIKNKEVCINERDVLGSTPLITAILFRRFDMIKLLLENGADVNKADIDGNTPIMYCTSPGVKPKIVKLL